MSLSQTDSMRSLHSEVLPLCVNCGTLMKLTEIKPDKPDYDQRRFDCAKCAHFEIFVVKYQ
jgi:hypothetical protein